LKHFFALCGVHNLRINKCWMRHKSTAYKECKWKSLAECHSHHVLVGGRILVGSKASQKNSRVKVLQTHSVGESFGGSDPQILLLPEIFLLYLLIEY